MLDTLASLSGKYGQWLNARGRRLCFIVWSFCMIYWAARDFNLGLYSQAVFCIFSLGFNVYGYVNWKRKGFRMEPSIPQEKVAPSVS